MTDEFGLHAAVAIEEFFKGEDDEHPVHVSLHITDAVLLPGPELRRDEVEDGDSGGTEMLGERKVHVGEVDEDGEVGALAANGGLELAVFAVDARHVEQ